MSFPKVKRVIYTNNPLDKVICQLVFPPILKIEKEIPSEFQERIRSNFPIYEEKTEFKFNVPNEFKKLIPQEVLPDFLPTTGNINHEFASEDGKWKINLTRNFIALTCFDYKRWEAFKSNLSSPIEALVDIYSPPFFSRIGLRYIDVIKRSSLGLDGIKWSELLQSYILGFLSSPDIEDDIRNLNCTYEMILSDKMSIAKIITKLVETKDQAEICFMIDSDFFITNKTEIQSSFEKLDFFNENASRLIQWSFKDQLRDVMKPKDIDE
ncbi:TIGR04255 family protein [Candidatus Latescibacterota bacterium]